MGSMSPLVVMMLLLFLLLIAASLAVWSTLTIRSGRAVPRSVPPVRRSRQPHPKPEPVQTPPAVQVRPVVSNDDVRGARAKVSVTAVTRPEEVIPKERSEDAFERFLKAGDEIEF